MDQKQKDALLGLAAYELVKEEELSDIRAEGYLMKHKKTGARIALIPCEDSNKVFNIAFRTPPEDSTGVAHIIEHTVLCGSDKYPLKDPFVELAKGSLNTFLNAMTYPDKTVYPVASTNMKDFKNLVDVYLDAVFHPNIYKEENIFKQEGWHYHLEKESDPLTINGVVYNEMKGVFSSPEDVLDRVTFNTLFPDTAYGVESGGDPKYIPDLTYENFLNFHRRYYHPSNSYIYLYGDMDMAKMLNYMDQEYLSAYDYLAIDSEVKYQKPFKAVKKIEDNYPVSDDADEEEQQTYLTYGVVLDDPFDNKKMLAVEALDYALFSAPGAPVKEALINSGIAKEVSGSFNDGILQPFYSITVKGAQSDRADAFEKEIRKVLKAQVKKGIDKKALLAGINYQEFSYREGDYSVYPKGLILGLNMFDTWLYNDDMPFEALKNLDDYAFLKAEVNRQLNEGELGYFEQMVQDIFLNNKYAALVVLKPEKGLAAKNEKALADELASYKAFLSREEIRKIAADTKALLAFQQKAEDPEALKKLPMLKRKDLKRPCQALSNIPKKIADVPVVYHHTITNGIGYMTLLFDLGEVPVDFMPELSLLTQVLGKVDTAKHPYQELDSEIGMHTGAINFGLSMYKDPENKAGYRAYLAVRMKAVYEELSNGFDLIREMLLTSDLDNTKRLNEILTEAKLRHQMKMQHMGHLIAGARCAAYQDASGVFSDQTAGIGFYEGLKKTEDEIADCPALVSDKLKLLIHMLVSKANMLVSFTCEKEGREDFEKALKAFVDEIPRGRAIRKRQNLVPYGLLNEAFTTAGQVQFVAKHGIFNTEKYPYVGHLKVLRQIMNYDYLWQNIRVTGGAYGCGANFTKKGSVTMRSYRDPNLKRSLDIYKKAVDYLREFDADEETMTKFIIGTIGGEDTPMTPSMFDISSMTAYMNDLTTKERQKCRDEILDCTAADIRALADYIKDAWKKSGICVVGSESAVEKDKKMFKNIRPLI